MTSHARNIICTGGVLGIQTFLNWYAELPYKYKILLAGNHDFRTANLPTP